ncbi:aspartate carbamoyltransferase [Candidatus Uhrbacteria bacterium]|nr:aspartate carbamoyltransferase [Candidatus Uhrbacteria bacterium]
MLVAVKKRFTPKVNLKNGETQWRNHVISVRQFTREDLDEVLFPASEKMLTMVQEVGKVGFLSGKVLACLFFEPSTRTMSSFFTAIERLGGSAIAINNVQFSSVSKGESLRDTIRTLGGYTDAIVMRHPEEGSVAKAAECSPVPIINAGDGKGEHPTQALLDLFTIQRELSSIDGLTVTMVGDLAHGRTVHSLARLLTLYEDVKINFVSPASLRMPAEKLAELRGQGVVPRELDRLDNDVVAESDVLYITRVQRERMTEEEKRIDNPFIVTAETMAHAKPKGKMILMHPLPRVGEISNEVDPDPRAAYFRQSEYGMYVRMGILKEILRSE